MWGAARDVDALLNRDLMVAGSGLRFSGREERKFGINGRAG